MAKASLIFVIGQDGVGKTTQARLLEREIARRGMKAEYVWMRWNHKTSLPLLGLARLLRLSKVERTQSGKKVVYHYFDRVKPIALTYQYTLFVDTALTMLFKIYSKMWLNDFLICDRSPYDTLVDLMISTRNPKLSDSYIGTLFLLLTGKATCFMLMADSDTLRHRRQDVSEDRDANLKTKLYNGFLSNSKCTHTLVPVNAREPIHEVYSNLLRTVGRLIDEAQ